VSGTLVGQLVLGNVDHILLVGAEFIDTVSDQDRYNA
jgi:hypothetical protein